MTFRILSLILAVLTVPIGATAAPGDLDPTLGSGGKVTTAIGASTDTAYSVAIDGSGRIVVAGYSVNSGNYDFALARYAANGNLDPTFGSGGKLTTAVGASSDVGYSVALDGSGRIVVAGTSYVGTNDFSLARYDSTGNLDPTFGSGGKVITPIGTSTDAAYSVAIDGSGRIVVAGSSYTGGTEDFAVARYASNGTLDPTFGVGGKVTTPIGSSGDVAFSVAIDGSGRIVVAGYSFNGNYPDFAVARYNADGSLDPTFGVGGKVTTAFGTVDDVGYSVAIDGSGRIVVAGYSWNGSDWDVAIARYTASGTLDPTFGSGGKVTTAFGSANDLALSTAIDGSGRIVIAGYSFNGADYDVALARYGASGNLDPTFGSGGKVITAIGASDDLGLSIAIDGGGRIVVAGSSANGGNVDVALARYLGTACGNAIAESGEQCDDGNVSSGDCCSATCQFESSGTVCRAASGACDVAETCTGSTGSCPVNSFAASGTSCTDDGNVCTDDQCDGSGACTHPNNAAACDDGFFCTGTDTCSEGSCSLHAGDPCIGGPECADTCDEQLDTCNAPAGAACSDDGSTCSLDVCDGSGACTHPAGNAGTTCRIPAGDCDLPETCDGASPTCPTDLFRPVSHTCRAAVGTCDVAENCSGADADCPTDGFVAAGIACTDDGQPCTNDACDGSGTCEHVALPDSDADSVCDAQDVCTNVGGGREFVSPPKSKLILTKVHTDATSGNEKLVLKGSFNLPAASSFGELTPSTHGARVVVRTSLGETVLDVALPALSYAGKGTRGWKTNTKGSFWQYLDKTGAPLNGVAALKAIDKSKGAPGGLVAVTISGKDGTYLVGGNDAPLDAVVVLGNQTDAIAGMCGESAYESNDCNFNRAGNTLKCQK